MFEKGQLVNSLKGMPGALGSFVGNIGLSNNKPNMGHAQLAKILLQQSQATQNPLVAALTGFVGASALSNIGESHAEMQAEEQAKEQAMQAAMMDMKKEAFELEKNKFELEARKLDETLALESEGRQLKRDELNQKADQFAQNLQLQKDQFNQKLLRDAQENAITKIPADNGIDLLFKGNAPITTGLEKGMQWGVTNQGKRIAVPIAKEPTQKAQQIKELALDTVNRLLKNKDGVKKNFGVFDQYTINVFDDARQAQTDLNQLRSILTAENLDLMTGVLSETDIKILQNVAGGGLAETATEEGVLRTLEDLKSTFAKSSSVPSMNVTAGGGSQFKILGLE